MPTITSTPGFWRMSAVLTACAAVVGYWIAQDPKEIIPIHKPTPNPDLSDVALTVHSYLLIPAFVGSLLLIAIVNRSASLGRAILILTAVVSLGVSRVLFGGYRVLLDVSGCRGICRAEPSPQYLYATYLLALLFGAVVPLGLALIAWPKPRPVPAAAE